MLTSPILEFESRVRACLPGLLRYLAMLGCEAARAEDLAQEALLHLWRKGLTEMDDRATAAWLCKAARYLYLDGVRADVRRRETELAELAQTVIEEQDAKDPYADRLERCLEKLDDRERDAVLRVYRKQEPAADVAASLGLTAAGLKTLLHRTKQALRACAERIGP